MRDHLYIRHTRPNFLRMRQEIEVTPTVKRRKIDLTKQGFDPAIVTVPLFLNDPRVRAFIPPDKDPYRAIMAGELRC